MLSFRGLMGAKRQIAHQDSLRKMAEMQAFKDQQIAADKFMIESGARTIIIKPDGTMVPIFD